MLGVITFACKLFLTFQRFTLKLNESAGFSKIGYIEYILYFLTLSNLIRKLKNL